MTTRKTITNSELDQKLAELNQYKIDLGLDRLTIVIERLGILAQLPQIITVGGTNGKGSTVAALCALLATQNKSFGAFTSPHIHAFNERVNVNDTLAVDAEILQAFAKIDAAKENINLSYFEYAFIAAVLIFIEHDVDVMVLEVGLGGRLDATNALDADACVITTVDLDHTEWLGDEIETIAKEKAGIMREGIPVVYGDDDIPKAIKNHAKRIGADLICYAQDYQINQQDDGLNYSCLQYKFEALPQPNLSGDFQHKNFASALTVLLALAYEFDASQLSQALNNWHINGRLQVMQNEPLVIADVSHNRQAAQQLASYLQNNSIEGHTRAVFSVLADKELAAWIGYLQDHIDQWFIFELDNQRAMNINDLKLILADHVSLFSQFKTAKEAYQMALSVSETKDRVIVFGSFHVLDEVFG